ncbi:HK97 gp10 family phage protein [Nonomuraea sp. NPDC050556]|uniref:HK97 gp10 family phage protein n=1 Tax=Nonomuraea sp. NPDC050556 TaxID=3364369 RepID=UPI00379D70BE
MGCTITMHDSEIDALLGCGGPIARQVRAVAQACEALSKATSKVDTGRLRASISLDMGCGGGFIRAEIFAPVNYAIYVHQGHGMIFPKSGKFLVFPGKGGGLVFAKSVRPVAPYPWLVRALEATSPWPVVVHS